MELQAFIVISLLVVASSWSYGQEQTVNIEPSLLQSSDENRTCIVTMRDRTIKVLTDLAGRVFNAREQRVTTVYDILRRLSTSSQRPLLSMLRRMGANFDSSWLTNQVIVRGCNQRMLQRIGRIRAVESVSKDNEYPLEPSDNSTIAEGSTGGVTIPTGTIQWGVQRIQAPELWRQNLTGRGIVVANIDTGVRYTHEVLRQNYRGGAYSWYDPVDKTKLPSDDDGHGTHTMGTIVGTQGYGVAYESKWIACKGCSSSSCSQSALIMCTQWVLCPTDSQGNNPKCDMAPNLVSNSWTGGNQSFVALTAALNAAGIIPLYAIGNTGPGCNTAASPGKYPNVIGVGATDSQDKVWEQSSVGTFNDSKPDFSAPGVAINSASNTGDNKYQYLSGTSMATPHAAGLTALLLQKNPTLSVDEVKAILKGSCVQIDTSNRAECGSQTGRTKPNPYVGTGLINAPAAARLTRNETNNGWNVNTSNITGENGGGWFPFWFF